MVKPRSRGGLTLETFRFSAELRKVGVRKQAKTSLPEISAVWAYTPWLEARAIIVNSRLNEQSAGVPSSDAPRHQAGGSICGNNSQQTRHRSPAHRQASPLHCRALCHDFAFG